MSYQAYGLECQTTYIYGFRNLMTVHFPNHTFVLVGPRIRLRPLTEADWPALLEWNNNPTILYYAEGDFVSGYKLAELQAIYRHIGQQAFCFMIEYDHVTIGECWLQRMNLDRILQRYPDHDCRRIDLTIGEQEYWGRGHGTEVIQLLTDFAFSHKQADYVFGCDIADYNPASLRAFQRVGYHLLAAYDQPVGSKARQVNDVVVSRDHYLRERQNELVLAAG